MAGLTEGRKRAGRNPDIDISSAAGASSRDRIMDTAERLMAERGFAAVSVREVTAAAQVHLSGITYHFGSKEMLLESIFERRASALNSERSALLDACDPQLTGCAPRIEEVLHAFCQPAFSLARQSGGARFLRLQRLMFAEDGPLSRRIKTKYYDPMSRRMIRMLGEALPELSPSSIYLRFNFLVGVLFSTLRDQTKVGVLSQGTVQIDPDAEAAEFMRFLLHGFRADLKKR